MDVFSQWRNCFNCVPQKKERRASGSPVALHPGLSGLFPMLILQGPHNKASGLALISHTQTVTLTFRLTRGCCRYKLLTDLRSAGGKTETKNTAALLSTPAHLKEKRERERRNGKVEQPQCSVLMLHGVCPITAVLSDGLCVG